VSGDARSERALVLSGRRAALLLLGLLAVVPTAVQAQEESPIAQDDPLFATLFPPELIMQHRRAIGLEDEQRDAISRLISDLQGRVLALQWELMDEVDQLGRITGGERVDLDRALDQMDAVLDTEKQIKQAHLEMLVRIKNLLTARQQQMLEELRGGAGG
jgi:Spy/CpxP family protein refolding chaperone